MKSGFDDILIANEGPSSSSHGIEALASETTQYYIQTESKEWGVLVDVTGFVESKEWGGLVDVTGFVQDKDIVYLCCFHSFPGI